MRRTGKVGLAASAVLAVGVVAGGALAVGQELVVDDNPGQPLTLEGVETGAADQDASAGSGARIRAEGTTPKVVEVVEQPVVNEVPPAGPVVISPRKPAPAPAPAPAPPAAPPAPGPAAPPKAPAPPPKAPKPPDGPKHDGPKDDGPKRDGPRHGGGDWGDGGGTWGDGTWGDLTP